MNNEMGFTLSELVVALAIVATLSFTALLNSPEITASFKRNAGFNYLEQDLERARAEALANGSQVIFAVAGGGVSYTYGFDSLPFNDPPSADEIEFTRVLPNGVTFNTSDTIVFDMRGFLVDDNGEYLTTTVSLDYDGSSYCSGTVAPSGYFDVVCNG